MNKFERLQPKSMKEKMPNVLEKMQQVYYCTYSKVAEPKLAYRIRKKSRFRKI